MSDDAEALEHAGRLADRVARRRGYTSADTEVESEEGRAPLHLGLHADVGDLSTGLSIAVRVQARGLRWQRRAEVWAVLLGLGVAAAVGAATVAVLAALMVLLQ